jgi:hypothetical protein
MKPESSSQKFIIEVTESAVGWNSPGKSSIAHVRTWIVPHPERVIPLAEVSECRAINKSLSP